MPPMIFNRTCATCELWEGERTVYQRGAGVQVNSLLDKGKCLHKTMNGVSRIANSPGCPRYVKWSELK